jgi:selT/selW/selH-like putative selenoprotein
MQITIEYCGTCNYRPRAAALAAAIQAALGVRPLLVHSSVSDTYKVIADGETIFSKYVTGAFPEKNEIIEQLKERQGAP